MVWYGAGGVREAGAGDGYTRAWRRVMRAVPPRASCGEVRAVWYGSAYHVVEHRGDVVQGELVLRKTDQEAGLTNGTIAACGRGGGKRGTVRYVGSSLRLREAKRGQVASTRPLRRSSEVRIRGRSTRVPPPPRHRACALARVCGPKRRRGVCVWYVEGVCLVRVRKRHIREQ